MKVATSTTAYIIHCAGDPSIETTVTIWKGDAGMLVMRRFIMWSAQTCSVFAHRAVKLFIATTIHQHSDISLHHSYALREEIVFGARKKRAKRFFRKVQFDLTELGQSCFNAQNWKAGRWSNTVAKHKTQFVFLSLSLRCFNGDGRQSGTADEVNNSPRRKGTRKCLPLPPLSNAGGEASAM